MDTRSAAGFRGIGRQLLRFVLWGIGVPAIAVLPFWASGFAAPYPGTPRVDLFGDIGAAGLLAGTAAAIGVLLVAALAARMLARQTVPRGVAWQRARILREEARRTGIPRYADPDAPGAVDPERPARPTRSPDLDSRPPAPAFTRRAAGARASASGAGSWRR